VGVIVTEPRVSRVLNRLAGLLWPLAIANLLVNILIVVTGGAVRLTASGLGCPTWPRCTDESYVAHGELGLHGAIEFGNRMLTGLVVVVAGLCILSAWRSGRRRATRLALAVAGIVPAQIVIGGISVKTHLNPWVVALHLLVSMAIIGICVLLLDEVRPFRRDVTPTGLRRLSWLVFGAGWLVLYLGTVVTGSGPHAGDEDARRTGLNPHVFSHVHAAAVYLLVALTLTLLVVAARGGHDAVRRAATWLLVIEVGQGTVGFLQYFNDLPESLVALHMLGAALTSAALAWNVLAQRVISGSSATATNSRLR
jgi:cytochrome c oxidase assembly protein subunit 15